jgi:hypothetical protein
MRGCEVKIEEVRIDEISNHERNPKQHPDKQIRLLEESIKRFGWTNPVILSADNTILAGHARVKAAIAAGNDTVPCIRTKLTGAEADAYLLADNRLSDIAPYDRDILDELLGGLPDDLVELTGFEVNAIDSYLDSNESNSAEVILENTEETAYSPNLKPVFSNPQVSNEDLEQARENIGHVTDKNVKQINAFCPNCGHEFMIGV